VAGVFYLIYTPMTPIVRHKYTTSVDYTAIITLSALKLHLRVLPGQDEEDGLYLSYLDTAARQVENYTSKCVIARPVEFYTDEAEDIELPIGPLNSVTSVQSFTGGSYTNVNAADYTFDLIGNTPRFKWINKPSIDDNVFNGVKITANVGYSTVPAPMLQAMRLLVSLYDDNRAEGTAPVMVHVIPEGVHRLLSSYRNLIV
jgi:uncharacterized phiE125 gp8 family phage protein